MTVLNQNLLEGERFESKVLPSGVSRRKLLQGSGAACIGTAITMQDRYHPNNLNLRTAAAAEVDPVGTPDTTTEGHANTRPADPKDLPDYAPIPRDAFGPALNEQGYYVGQVERNLYWLTDGTYQSAFLTTPDGVVLFDAPPTIGHNIQRAVDEIASANGLTNKVTHLIYSHHHADHNGASSLFDNSVTRIGHEDTRRLLLRENDPARPAPEETFGDTRTVEFGGERIELTWLDTN